MRIFSMPPAAARSSSQQQPAARSSRQPATPAASSQHAGSRASRRQPPPAASSRGAPGSVSPIYMCFPKCFTAGPPPAHRRHGGVPFSQRFQRVSVRIPARWSADARELRFRNVFKGVYETRHACRPLPESCVFATFSKGSGAGHGPARRPIQGSSVFATFSSVSVRNPTRSNLAL